MAEAIRCCPEHFLVLVELDQLDRNPACAIRRLHNVAIWEKLRAAAVLEWGTREVIVGDLPDLLAALVEFDIDVEPVDLADLEVTRETIVTAMVADMPDAHRHFLVGFKRGEPDWALLGIPEAKLLPAVLWKQRNLDRLSTEKRRELADVLGKVLFG